MGFAEQLLALLGPFAPYLALGLVLLVGLAVVKGEVSGGGNTLGLVLLAVVLFLAGIYLILSGWLWYGLLALTVAALVGIGDGVHEKRLNRRHWARYRE